MELIKKIKQSEAQAQEIIEQAKLQHSHKAVSKLSSLKPRPKTNAGNCAIKLLIKWPQRPQK